MVIEHRIILKAKNQVIFFKKFDSKLFKTRKFIQEEENSTSSDIGRNKSKTDNRLATKNNVQANHALKPTQRGYFTSSIQNSASIP